MLPQLINIQYFSYTNINGIYGRNLKLDYFLPLSTKLKKVEFDIYLNIKPKLSEQLLPHQWRFTRDWNIKDWHKR